ncbi:MAG TPA: tetratricopeptide repeat protein [Candidatus Dormibacteraeota bacterium]|nr:tetratricopeptide repeat protein [Candidatus Dormibacteraeota bacterium]
MLTWLVFGQTLRHDFINYDDPRYVYENTKITGGLSISGIAWAFTHIHSMNWHPLTTISHMLDCQLYGLNAGWHHFTNVLLHTLAAILLFLALQQMTGAVWRSAFVAAVFAIHPLRVESVAWVAERKDVLSGVCFMLTLLAYVYYTRAPSLSRYLAVALVFVLGLMSKPMLVTLPLVLLVLDYWPLRRIGRQTSDPRRQLLMPVLEKIPLIAFSAVSGFVTLLAQKGAVGWTEDLPILERINNAAVSYVLYIWQMFWPMNLAVFYPHPENRLPLWEIISSLLLLICITALAIAVRKKRPYLITGWLWYLGMLVPVIGLVQVGWQGRADRYTYLPQIGLYIAITWAVADLTNLWRRQRTIVSAAAILIISALSLCAWVQTSYWRDSETLFRHALAVTANNDVAENNLGIVFLRQGKVDEAISLLQTAVDLRPDNSPAHDNLAKALLQKGHVADALIHYRKLLELQPDNIEVHNIVGTVLIQQGRVGEGVEEWQKVLAIQPDNGNAMSNLAWVFATAPDQSLRDGPKAVGLAEQALRISGGRIAILFRTLAAAYAESGEFSKAIQTAQQGIELANSQGNSGLATELQGNIALYQEQRPLRDPSLTHGTSPSHSE